jgi:hypothetical protein
MSESINVPGRAETGSLALPLLHSLADNRLYRGNAFRIIGAPVRSTARDITRRSERLKLAEQIGAPLPGGGPLPLEKAADAELVREALRRVRDPEHRLLEELFWFWPQDAASASPDAALTALEHGDTAAAVDLWSREATGVGDHNRAVLCHTIALDLESADVPLGEDARRRRDRCWKEALSSWKACLDSEPFWSRVEDRIRELDDPRLSIGTGRRIRETLPSVLLSINARLALAAADRGLDHDANRHIDLIDQSGFGAAAADKALELVLEPVRQRVLTLCRTAEAESTPAPDKANATCVRLLEQTAPLLASLTLLPERHPIRESAHDEVAHRALQCQILYGNKTEDWRTSLALLNVILPVCGSESARRRVQSNIEIVQANVAALDEFGTCFFCGTRKPEAGKEVEVKLHGNVQHLGVRVTWNQLTMKVPRCGTCKSRDNRGTGWATLAFLVTAISGFVSCGMGPDDDGAAAIGIAGVIAGGIAAAVVNNFSLAGSKPSTQASKFPAVQRKIAEGWAFGDKPQGVQ